MSDFSVLMSIYNGEKADNLTDSLGSILNQTLKPTQVVLVLDGPIRQELMQVINRFKDVLPLEIIKIEANVGLAAALNKGLKSCHYDLIARMDTDDICRSDRFERQVFLMKKHPEIGITGSYIDEFYESHLSPSKRRVTPINHQEIIRYSKYRNPFNHMTVMFRKHLVTKYGAYPDQKFAQDYHLWMNMIHNGVIGHNISEPLVFARTGRDLFKRRGGIKYFSIEKRMFLTFYRNGYINKCELATNLVYRYISRIISPRLRENLYLKFLRN